MAIASPFTVVNVAAAPAPPPAAAPAAAPPVAAIAAPDAAPMMLPAIEVVPEKPQRPRED